MSANAHGYLVLRWTPALAFVTVPARGLDHGAELDGRLDLANRSLPPPAWSSPPSQRAIPLVGALLFAMLRASRVYPGEALGTSPRGVLVRVGI